MKNKLLATLVSLTLLLTMFFCAVVVPVNVSAAAEYVITYHLDGGTNALKNPDVYTIEDTITLMDATKVGYDFVGWYSDAEKTEQINVISNRVGDLDLYAKFAPKTYMGIFNDDGATSSNPIRVTLTSSGQTKTVTLNKGDSFDPYSYWTPTLSGYVFLGWYRSSGLVSGTLELRGDESLEAKWSKCDKSGYSGVLGGNLSSASVSTDTYNGIYNSTKYVYISGGVTTVRYSGKSAFKNVYYLDQYKTTLYGDFAIYDETNKELLVDGSEGGYGEKSGNLTVAPGTLLRITATGQYASINLGYSVNGSCSISIGKRKSSTIAASNYRAIEQEFDSMITTPDVKKTGYDLIGWYGDDGNEMSETWIYPERQTFTAKWQPIKYNIVYNLDGGTNHAANPAKYTIEDSITLKDPQKPGYTFKGWYLDPDFYMQVTSITHKAENITLYAQWEVNSYNLTLDANIGTYAPKVTFISDGVEIKSYYLDEQDSITAYRPANKDGYIFAGWYSNSACTSLFKFNGTIANDITLYAKWVECNSNIINIESAETINTTIQGKTEQLYAFVPLVDGTITVTSESNNLDLYGRLYDASKNSLVSCDDIGSTDLDFTYTYNVKAGQLYYISVKGNTVSTTGQAVINVGWTGNCTITGTTYKNRELTIVYDTDYKLPQKPVCEGYVFLGWYDENGTQITDGVWNFATDKTLTAKWEEATYHTVVFKDLAGNIISSETYYLSEDIVAPELPTKAPDETYIYHAKWDNGYTGVCTGDAVYTPTFDLEYIEYAIVFVDEDGTEISRATYHYGDAVVVPAAPSKAADHTYTYVFAGWDNEVVNCVGNTTYTATYDPIYIEYTVVFKDWDGTVLSEQIYHYGDEITTPTAPSKPTDGYYSYTFNGWDNEVVNCNGNIVYTATYRSTEHRYSNACDATCNNCGATRTPAAHVYSNACDTSCNVCGAYRSITHNYAPATCTAPKTCRVCGATSGSALGHEYSNACDTSCNVCGAYRSITHNYAPATCTTPKTCRVCGATSGSALGLAYNAVVTAPDCVSGGYTTYTCTDCGDSYVADRTEALGHDYTAVVTAPDCVNGGFTTYTCTDCGDSYVGSWTEALGHDYADATCTTPKICSACGGVTIGAALGHTYSNACDKSCNRCKATRTVAGHDYEKKVTKATTTKDGKIKNVCSECGYTSSKVTTIYKASKISLSTTSYTYNGSTKKPAVTVKNSMGKTISTAHYTVTYASGRKNVGTYKVTVKFKGNYSGTKTLTFKINPAKTTVKSLTAGKKSLKVAITKKSTQVTGYQIQYSTGKSFKSYKTKWLTSYKKTSTTLSGLSAKKTYYVRVRTYKTVNGTKYYSGWSTIKYKKTK